MSHQFIAAELGKSGLCVFPNYLSAQMLKDMADDLHRLRQEGRFRKAGTGHIRDTTADNRRDETYWLDEAASDSAVQAEIWRNVNSLRQAFNRTLFLNLNGFEGHYAAYPPGGFYKRHRDSLRADSRRTVSMVIYLNRDWHSDHGGRLRIYGEGDSYADVDPIGGTMVCFLSRESEHEVLTSHKERFSLAGWFISSPAMFAGDSLR